MKLAATILLTLITFSQGLPLLVANNNSPKTLGKRA